MAKFITKFDTTAKLAAFSATTDFGRPHVSLTEDDSKVHYFEDNSHNGHQYVDLGLPSGTKWATMNVGASSETDYGNYYQYGKGAAQYAVTSGDSIYRGTDDPLAASADTASQVWGGSWHMPTREQMQELIDNTTCEWVENYEDGINGYTFTANNAVLFLPAAGYWYHGSQRDDGVDGSYCGSSPKGSDYVYVLNFKDGYEGMVSYDREYGFPVRPVVGIFHQ